MKNLLLRGAACALFVPDSADLKRWDAMIQDLERTMRNIATMASIPAS
ncbi:hypothetical protein [Massilia violaceinigra]|nr:hypothetical protein [Massilia violaceinigra]